MGGDEVVELVVMVECSCGVCGVLSGDAVCRSSRRWGFMGSRCILRRPRRDGWIESGDAPGLVGGRDLFRLVR